MLTLNYCLGNTKSDVLGTMQHLGSIKYSSPYGSMGFIKSANGGGFFSWMGENAGKLWNIIKDKTSDFASNQFQKFKDAPVQYIQELGQTVAEARANPQAFITKKLFGGNKLQDIDYSDLEPPKKKLKRTYEL